MIEFAINKTVLMGYRNKAFHTFPFPILLCLHSCVSIINYSALKLPNNLAGLQHSFCTILLLMWEQKKPLDNPKPHASPPPGEDMAHESPICIFLPSS